MIVWTKAALAASNVGLGAPASAEAPSSSGLETAASSEWLACGYGAERTGWNRGETDPSKDIVEKQRIVWKTKLSTRIVDVVLSTLMAPVVANGVLFATSTGGKAMQNPPLPRQAGPVSQHLRRIATYPLDPRRQLKLYGCGAAKYGAAPIHLAQGLNR
jgi:hypothetical protein